MTDKLQKIKEWISKTQDGLMDAQDNFEYPEHEGAYHILCNLDTYIDSMQEEPTIPDIVDEHFDEMLGEEPVSEDLETELDKYIKDHFTIDKEQLDRFGLEEKDYMYSMDKSDMLAMVHHFVGKHQEPVSEDFDALDQLLAKYAIDFSYKGKTLKECSGRYKAEIIATANHLEPVSKDLEKAMQHNAPDNIGIDDLLYWRNGFIAGAKWQKEKEYTCYEEAFEDGAKWKVENLWKPADGDDLPEIDREVIALLDNGKVVFAHRPAEYWDGKNIMTGKVTRYYPKTHDKGGWNIPDVKWWLDCSLPKEIEL